MLRLLFLNLFCLLFFFMGFGQRERIHVDFDKYSCRAGDTIYFKGVIFKGLYPTSVSTSLYVSLYTENGGLLQRSVFPIVHGQSIGQVILPDTIATNNYYVLAYTKEQLNYDSLDFFSVPILVYNREKPAIVYHKIQTLRPSSATASTIKGISWTTSVFNGKLSSLLEIDSGSNARNLQLISPVSQDSMLRADVTLTNSNREKYSLFPIDTTKENEVLLLYEDSKLLGRQVIHLKDKPRAIKLITDTLNTSPFGYNSWRLEIPDSTVYFTSITVADADRSQSSPSPITRLEDPYTDNFTVPESLIDTAFISYSGKATKESGGRIKDAFSQEIAIAGVQDSNFIFTKVMKMDATGNFRLDSLIFFGTIDLQFQLNKGEDEHAKDVRLSTSKFIPPVVDTSVFQTHWEEDVVPVGKMDSSYTKTELEKSEFAKFKPLEAVVVRSRKNYREELDKKYTTGPFSEPALYSYDLRNDKSDYDRDIFWYINTQCNRLRYDPANECLHDALGHPIHYFVDEVEYEDSHALLMFDFDRLAYIKILESDFLSTKDPMFKFEDADSVKGLPNSSIQKLRLPDQKTAINVCLYTRKGTDFRTMRGGLNKVALKGYNEILRFNTDKVTLYWDPLAFGHTFRIRFNNAETTKRFRVKMEGMSNTGKIIHFETIVQTTADPALAGYFHP
jgi:hypothetical protein